MPEPIKNVYNSNFVKLLSKNIKLNYNTFNEDNFTKDIFNKNWEQKELKERMRHITHTLYSHLPQNYIEALNILIDSSTNMERGFAPVIFPDFVEIYGLDYYDESIQALEHFTKTSTSEFAIRHFLIKYEEKTMKQMLSWAKSDNYHVRRLASEGSRPRLPWAIGLPSFKKDPVKVIEILNILKNDPEEYVRRSVANNLNDISKDNPEIVISLSKKWIGINDNINWLIKHGNRTLLKNGNSETLSLFGFEKVKNIKVNDFNCDSDVKEGDKFNFSFNLTNNNQKLGKLRIEFAIYFMKKNGKQSKKVFKISESNYDVKNKMIYKYFSFKSITTRKYHKGEHSISIIVNGIELNNEKFLLK